MNLEVRDLRPGDWPEVARIYREGIETGNATFETEVPSWEAWDSAHLPVHRMVAERDGRIVGWAALVPVSPRECGRGRGERVRRGGSTRRGRRLGAPDRSDRQLGAGRDLDAADRRV